MRLLTLAAAATLSVALGWTADVQKKDVDIQAPDGTNLKGTYFSAGRPGPGMILLHQCNMDRHAWDGLAQDLAGAGFHVLTVDFRAASEGDTSAAKGIREAEGASKNPQSTVKIYGGTEHGVPMFAKNGELEPMIVAWLKAQVMVPAGKLGHVGN